MTARVECLIDTVAFNRKPDNYESGAITNRFKTPNREIDVVTIEELSLATSKGFTISLATFNGVERNVNSLRAQQVFALDFDNDNKKITLKDAIKLAKSKGIKPTYAYHTFSHGQNGVDKFRLMFVSPEPITSLRGRAVVTEALLTVFDGYVDTKCRNASRIIYGGVDVAYKDYSATLDIDHISNLYTSLVTEKPTQKGIKASNSNGSSTVGVSVNTDNNVAKGGRAHSTPLNASNGNDLKGIKLTHNYNSIYNYSCALVRGGSIPVKSMTREDFISFTMKLPLDEVLQLPLDTPFRCIRPDHDDNNPSASITMLDDDTYVYNCWSCIGAGMYMNLINLYAELKGISLSKAIDELASMMGISLESEFQQQAIKDITNNVNLMNSSYFTNNYSIKRELIRANAWGLFIEVLDFARASMSLESITGDGRPSFFVSMSRLSQIMKEKNMKGTDKSTISRKIVYLCKLGMIEKVDFDTLPSKVLANILNHRNKQAKAYCDALRLEGEGRDKVMNEFKLQSYYIIPEYTHDLLTKAHQHIEYDKGHSVRRRYQTKEQTERTYGKEVADSIYVQDKQTTPSPVLDRFYTKYKEVAETLLASQRYFTEQEVLSSLKGYKKAQKEDMSGKCLPQLIKELGVTKKRPNKQIRIAYQVPKSIKSQAIIFVK